MDKQSIYGKIITYFKLTVNQNKIGQNFPNKIITYFKLTVNQNHFTLYIYPPPRSNFSYRFFIILHNYFKRVNNIK